MSQSWDRLAAILAAAAAMPKAEAAAFVEREIALLHDEIARRAVKAAPAPEPSSPAVRPKPRREQNIE